MNLPELISPERAAALVLFAAIALSFLGAGLGFWKARARGLSAILLGPLIYGMWIFHNWITRYDQGSGYFGLDKVAVLGLECVVFVGVGTVLGLVWKRILASNKRN